MSVQPPRDRAVTDRRARDRRIRELKGIGWSSAAIATVVGVSDARVRQILLASTLSREEAIEAGEHDLQVELLYITDALAQITKAAVGHRARVMALQRSLARLEEERETQRIDRLLGLPG